MKLRRLVFPSLLIVLILPTLGRAFTRSRDPTSGRCLWWKQRQVTYLVNENCSADLAVGPCLDAAQRSFQVWADTTCSDMIPAYGGTTPRTDAGFDKDNWDNNINLVVWVENGWEHGRTAIALTTTTFDTANGEIVDADIEMNGENYTFTATQPALTQTDIQNTLVHEAGHVVGLDHSFNTDASMYKEAQPGEIQKRDLLQDDIDGICTVYPTGGDTPRCVDDPDPENTGCCASAGGGQPPAARLWLLAVAGLLVQRARRRNRGR